MFSCEFCEISNNTLFTEQLRTTASILKKNWHIEKFSFPSLKKFVFRSVFGEFKLTKISMNFKTSCCTLKSEVVEKNWAKLSSTCFNYFFLNWIAPLFSCEKTLLKIVHDRKGTEAAIKGVLWKKVLSEISKNSQENNCARVSFSIKLQVSSLQFY